MWAQAKRHLHGRAGPKSCHRRGAVGAQVARLAGWVRLGERRCRSTLGNRQNSRQGARNAKPPLTPPRLSSGCRAARLPRPKSSRGMARLVLPHSAGGGGARRPRRIRGPTSPPLPSWERGPGGEGEGTAPIPGRSAPEATRIPATDRVRHRTFAGMTESGCEVHHVPAQRRGKISGGARAIHPQFLASFAPWREKMPFQPRKQMGLSQRRQERKAAPHPLHLCPLAPKRNPLQPSTTPIDPRRNHGSPPSHDSVVPLRPLRLRGEKSCDWRRTGESLEKGTEQAGAARPSGPPPLSASRRRQSITASTAARWSPASPRAPGGA
jgi:hypothetical protein